MEFDISNCPIGKDSLYPESYDPSVIFPIPRLWSREKTFGKDLASSCLFRGFDIWNGYEFIWTDPISGAMRIGFIRILIPSDSEFLVESKSLKLYLFSFSGLKKTFQELEKIISADLSRVCQSQVRVQIVPFAGEHDSGETQITENMAAFWNAKARLSAQELLLNESLSVSEYKLNANLLGKNSSGQKPLTGGVFSFSHFRSNCIVTGKPDWADVTLGFEGAEIDESDLYLYLCSFRTHKGIHEQCIEKILFDIDLVYNPRALWVLGNFTRRGGLDINPLRFIGHLPELEHEPESYWQRMFRQ